MLTLPQCSGQSAEPSEENSREACTRAEEAEHQRREMHAAYRTRGEPAGTFAFVTPANTSVSFTQVHYHTFPR